MSQISELFFINSSNGYTNFYELFSKLTNKVNNEEHIYISFYLLFKNFYDVVDIKFDNDKIKNYMKYLSILFLLNLIKINVIYIQDDLVYNIILFLKKEKENEKIKDIYNNLISHNETDKNTKKKIIKDNVKTKFQKNIINNKKINDTDSIFSNDDNEKQFDDYTDKLYLFTIQYIFNEICLLKNDDIKKLFKDFNTFYSGGEIHSA